MGDPVSIALLAGTALSTASGVAGAVGDARAQGFKAEQAATAARFGKIAAAETDTALREELASVVSNIRAIRASSGISPDSPTTQAIIARESEVSDRERRIRVANILGQVEEDEKSSAFLKKSARDTFLYGSLGSFGRGFSSLSRLSGG
jgi:hypothetical protein